MTNLINWFTHLKTGLSSILYCFPFSNIHDSMNHIIKFYMQITYKWEPSFKNQLSTRYYWKHSYSQTLLSIRFNNFFSECAKCQVQYKLWMKFECIKWEHERNYELSHDIKRHSFFVLFFFPIIMFEQNEQFVLIH